MKLKGNYLHILCESSDPTNGSQLVESLIEALKFHRQYPIAPEYHRQPIYQVILYGKVARKKKPDWIKAISLSGSDSSISGEQGITKSEAVNDAGYLVTTQNLAKTGAPEAIARYLSDSFTSLGISIAVKIEILPTYQAEQRKRMWVSCEGNYSPDFALIADPIATKLRNLELVGFVEAVIEFRVQGESECDWRIKADLTHPNVMLREWANWGDTGAIAELLNQQLQAQQLQSQLILKNKTLHIFCSTNAPHQAIIPPKELTVAVIMELLQELAPQGIRTATIYGTLPFRDRTLEAIQDDKPQWVDWQPLAASLVPALADSARDLAVKGNLDALNYLLQRVLNPRLTERLSTGGIRVKLKLHNHLLHILTEGVVCPQKEQVLKPITQFFKGFRLKEIKGLRVYARYAGHTQAHWRDKIDFEPRVSGPLVHLDEPAAIRFEGEP
ncbi:MAG: hypothetical protein HC796_02205 [Synechococcaceae cyanobacterium RL_1_2]|nr:hypothetical protein [Synechococcaceae cyanobacterium RL_1_2]